MQYRFRNVSQTEHQLKSLRCHWMDATDNNQKPRFRWHTRSQQIYQKWSTQWIHRVRNQAPRCRMHLNVHDQQAQNRQNCPSASRRCIFQNQTPVKNTNTHDPNATARTNQSHQKIVSSPQTARMPRHQAGPNRNASTVFAHQQSPTAYQHDPNLSR